CLFPSRQSCRVWRHHRSLYKPSRQPDGELHIRPDRMKEKVMEPRHIVTAFDAELRQLESLIMEMGGLVETQISAAADALLHRDTEMAEKVRSSDRRVDALNDEIDSR